MNRLVLSAFLFLLSAQAFAGFADFAEKLKKTAESVQAAKQGEREPAAAAVGRGACDGPDALNFYTLVFNMLKMKPEIKVDDKLVDKWWEGVPDTNYSLVKDDEFKVGEEREKIKKELMAQVEKADPKADKIFKFETDVTKYDMAKGAFAIAKENLFSDKGKSLRNPAHVEPMMTAPLGGVTVDDGQVMPKAFVFKVVNPEVFGMAKVEKDKAQILTRDNNRRLQFALRSKIEKIDLKDKAFPNIGVVYLKVADAKIYSDFDCTEEVGTLIK